MTDLVAPGYGRASLAELLPAALAVLGVDTGTDALGLTERLAGVRRIAVLLVDGLGAELLPDLAPVAPVLAAPAAVLTCGFPSTTPTSLTTLGTGEPPGRHGVVGSRSGSRTPTGCCATSRGTRPSTRVPGSRCPPVSSARRRPGSPWRRSACRSSPVPG